VVFRTRQCCSAVAVDSVSLTVGRGKVLGLLGPNGAGKTTVVKMLTTLTSIDSGSASVGGNDVANDAEEVRRVIGLAGQAAAVDEMLTAREDLELFARLYKLPRSVRRKRIGQLIERFDMAEFADRQVSRPAADEHARFHGRRPEVSTCNCRRAEVPTFR